MDSGRRWGLLAIDGQVMRAWNERGDSFESRYDILRRSLDTRLFGGGLGAGKVVGKVVYGDTEPNPEINNMRGQIARTYDQAGVAASEAYDFEGNPLSIYRQLAKEYKAVIDWGAATSPELLQTRYRTTTTYDALRRATQVAVADSATVRPTYGRDGHVVKISLRNRCFQGLPCQCSAQCERPTNSDRIWERDRHDLQL